LNEFAEFLGFRPPIGARWAWARSRHAKQPGRTGARYDGMVRRPRGLPDERTVQWKMSAIWKEMKSDVHNWGLRSAVKTAIDSWHLL